LIKHPQLGVIFLELVKHRTAGSPQEEQVFWTHYTVKEIQDKMSEKGAQLSLYDVRNLLKFFNYKRRSLAKTEEFAQVEGRNEQFEKIAEFKDAFIKNGYPVFSLDSKKKELLGNFHRAGTSYSTISQQVYDHDFVSFAQGKVIPHGIYDLADNKGYLTLGTSKDTSTLNTFGKNIFNGNINKQNGYFYYVIVVDQIIVAITFSNKIFINYHRDCK